MDRLCRACRGGPGNTHAGAPPRNSAAGGVWEVSLKLHGLVWSCHVQLVFDFGNSGLFGYAGAAACVE